LAEVIRPWAPTARGKYFAEVFSANYAKIQSFEPLISFPKFLVQNLWPKTIKFVILQKSSDVLNERPTKYLHKISR